MAQQYHTFEPSGKPLTVAFEVTKQDFFDALVLQQRAKGVGRRIFQMSLALVLAFGMFYSWLRDTSYTMGLVLAIICVLMFWMLLFLPGFMMKRTAAMLSEHIQKLEFKIYENGAVINDGMGELMFPADDTAVCVNDKMYLFENHRQQVYPLLRRQLDPMEKRILEQILESWPAYYVFSETGNGVKRT